MAEGKISWHEKFLCSPIMWLTCDGIMVLAPQPSHYNRVALYASLWWWHTLECTWWWTHRSSCRGLICCISWPTWVAAHSANRCPSGNSNPLTCSRTLKWTPGQRPQELFHLRHFQVYLQCDEKKNDNEIRSNKRAKFNANIPRESNVQYGLSDKNPKSLLKISMGNQDICSMFA